MCLQVRREARIDFCHNIDRLETRALALHGDPVLTHFNLSARCPQSGERCLNGFGDQTRQLDGSTHHGRDNGKGASFDTVCQHRVGGAAKFRNTLDADCFCARPFDLCAHGIKTSGEISDFGFARCIFQQRLVNHLCQDRFQQHFVGKLLKLLRQCLTKRDDLTQCDFDLTNFGQNHGVCQIRR